MFLNLSGSCIVPFPWDLVVILKHNQYCVFLKIPPWHLFSRFYFTYIFSNLNSFRSPLKIIFVHSVGGNGLQHITASLCALNRTTRCHFKVWEDTTLIVFFAFRLVQWNADKAVEVEHYGLVSAICSWVTFRIISFCSGMNPLLP